MKVVYFGTPHIAAEVLKYLLKNGVDICAVVTKPDRPHGRSKIPLPPPVKEVALLNKLPLLQPEMISSPENAEILKSFDADLFVVVAYGEILKQHVLDIPKVACINLHASLLPKYRGAAPIQRVIMNGEAESGVTIMHMVRKMDAGDMIHQVKVPISQDMTAGDLEESLTKIGQEALLQTIHEFSQGTPVKIPQEHDQATLAPKVELEECELNWELPASTLHNLVRGVNPEPGAWCWAKLGEEQKRLKIFKTSLEPSKQGWPVLCGTGTLFLLEVQLEGKKRMPIQDLLRGILEKLVLK